MNSHDSSAVRGRLLIVLVAVLWSTSGAFTKVLTLPHDHQVVWFQSLQLNTPKVGALQIAFYRTLFAGLVLLPFLRKQDFSFRPMMLPMVASFAIMNATFVPALALGSAANAIVLQYTAPMWVFLACIWWLGEKADSRSFWALAIGLVGIVIIVAGGWQDDQLRIVGLGLGSGLAYAGVMVSLRVLRDASSRWLTVLNHLVSALVLVPFVCTLPMLRIEQLGWIFLFGTIQMAIPYWLMARGLKSISPQEAGIITLLEPLLNPYWAYLVSGEKPEWYTLAGGVFIVGALAWRYWPRIGAAETPFTEEKLQV